MIAIFIGSFNPPTKAHLDICLKLKNNFSQIVLVPVNSNEKNVININHRINMLNIMRHKYPFLEVSDIMKKYSYVNYRIIDLLKDKYGNIKLIIGSDLLKKISSFDNYEYLLKNYQYIVIIRNNDDVEKIIQEKYLKYQDKFYIINFNNNISSTMVRKKLKEKKDLKSIIDNDILDYIQKYHLY